MSISRTIVLFAVALLASQARADQFSTLVGLKCNRQTDRLIIYYIGAYNEAADAMLTRKNSSEWNPALLFEPGKDDDHLGEMKTILRTCELSHGLYEIRIGPSPGNTNVQGECGVQFSAWVEIRRN